MASTIIYRQGSESVAMDAITMAAVTFRSLTFTWPDYPEHDLAKECVQVNWINFRLDRISVTALLAAATNDSVFVGWRSGAFTLTAPMSRVSWLHHLLFAKVAATVGLITPECLEKRVEYSTPIVCSGSYVSIATDLASSGATAFDASGNLVVTAGYKWIKAGPSELNAYLRWETFPA